MQVIVTLTMNSAIDTSATVDHVIPERKLRCQPPRHEPGGGGLNVSRAIQKLGGASTAVYPVGGPTGQMLQHLLDMDTSGQELGVRRHDVAQAQPNPIPRTDQYHDRTGRFIR